MRVNSNVFGPFLPYVNSESSVLEVLPFCQLAAGTVRHRVLN
jgi:hypothetical protein